MFPSVKADGLIEAVAQQHHDLELFVFPSVKADGLIEATTATVPVMIGPFPWSVSVGESRRPH